jgi:hypothetical protein
MNPADRRRVGRLIQVALVVIGLAALGLWVARRVDVRTAARLETPATEVPASPLAAGDLKIYSTDSSTAVTLSGDRLLAGLSEKTIARVRGEMARDIGAETTGLGGSIAGMVRRTVATAMGSQMVYPLAEIRDLRLDGDQLVIDEAGGGTTTLFRNVRVDGSRDGGRFRAEDAQRLIEAVRARKAELGKR